MQVLVHKAADGKYFEDQAEFAAHETMLKTAAALQQVILDSPIELPRDAQGAEFVFRNDIAGFIMANLAAIQTALTSSVVPTRQPRARKAVAVTPETPVVPATEPVKMVVLEPITALDQIVGPITGRDSSAPEGSLVEAVEEL